LQHNSTLSFKKNDFKTGEYRFDVGVMEEMMNDVRTTAT